MNYSKDEPDCRCSIRLVTILSLCIIGFVLTPLPSFADLIKEQKKIQQKYPQVEHISADQLQAALHSNKLEIVLFDVRYTPEYAVSHIADAIHVDPNTSGEEFVALHRDKIQGKYVVFYCSVGYRSSHLASLVQSQALNRLSTNILNLRHGLFGWHNDEKQLVRGDSPTEFIHPYNFWWGRLLERQHLTSYDPE